VKKRLAYRLFVKLPFWLIVGSVILVTLLKWVPVWYTPLMLKRSVEYRKVEEFHTRQRWVSLEKMSPELIQAVIASEDNRFCEHKGFDWEEMDRMLKAHREKGKKLRGCSTISQQTAKNVFTFGSHTWARKALETYWTFLIEKIWGKQRIMEVYLNVAETGLGLYGMEAAARQYYGVHAKELNRPQASALAATLPAPLTRNPAHPTDYFRKRQRQISNLIPNLSYPDWAK
jgi:monofunctional biosynthetic peptidoglycan transglycosylase